MNNPISFTFSRISLKQCCNFGGVSKICYYKILKVSTSASFDQIKQSYFDLAKKYHPDASPNQNLESLKFQQIQEAYQTLSNDVRRKDYDDRNGIISFTKQGGSSFGETQAVYDKFASTDPLSIYQKHEADYVEYYQKQYFENKDFFKKKVDEDNPWNFSEKLFMKHQEIKKKKDEFTIHEPFQDQAYYVRKDELKDTSNLQIASRVFMEFKYAWFAAGLAIGGYYVVSWLEEQNKNRQNVSKNERLSQGPGYRLKLTPTNIS